MYHKRGLQHYINQTGNYRVPHSRRMLTNNELSNIRKIVPTKPIHQIINEKNINEFKKYFGFNNNNNNNNNLSNNLDTNDQYMQIPFNLFGLGSFRRSDPLYNENYKNIENLNMILEEHMSILHYVVLHKFTEGLKFLIKKKYNLERKTSTSKFTPLYIAIIIKWDEGVELLLKAGANANAKDVRGMSMLQYAGWRKYLKGLNLLIKHGASLNNSNNNLSNGDTPLTLAVSERFDNGVESLLKAGSNVNKLITYGETALTF